MSGRQASMPRLELQAEVGDFVVRQFAFEPRLHMPRHVHERPMFVAMLQGGYQGVMPNDTYEAGAGELVAVPPDIPHYDTVGDSSAVAILIEPPDPGDEAFPRAVFERLQCFKGDRVNQMLRQLGREVWEREPFSKLAAESLLLDLVSAAARIETVRESHRPHWLLRLRDRLNDGFKIPLSLSELALESGVSRAHLTRTFRRFHGCSIGDYVRQRRVARAAWLLRASDQPLAEIAQACGFYDQSHMCRLMRQQLDTTPSSIRRQR